MDQNDPILHHSYMQIKKVQAEPSSKFAYEADRICLTY